MGKESWDIKQRPVIISKGSTEIKGNLVLKC